MALLTGDFLYAFLIYLTEQPRVDLAGGGIANVLILLQLTYLLVIHMIRTVRDAGVVARSG